MFWQNLINFVSPTGSGSGSDVDVDDTPAARNLIITFNTLTYRIYIVYTFCVRLLFLILHQLKLIYRNNYRLQWTDFGDELVVQFLYT